LRIKTDKIAEPVANPLEIQKYTKEIDRLHALLTTKEEQLKKALEELEVNKQSMIGLKQLLLKYTEDLHHQASVEEQKHEDNRGGSPQQLVAQLEQALREIRDMELKV
jgi:predicted  nucleic acid-binding Zn-ribbon protein